MDKNYWKNYYKLHKVGEKPSLFAEFVLTRLNESALNDKNFRGDSSDSHNDEIVTTSPNLTQPFKNDLVETSHNPKSSDFITLLELGCGNGRDALFFAKNGIKVTAIDQVADEISYLASICEENPHFISGDFTDLEAIFNVNSACSDFLGSASPHCNEANSPLGNHCIDLVFPHKARTQSPLSLCKNTKNSTSTTLSRRLDKRSEVPNARIFSNANDGESQKDSSNSINANIFSESQSDSNDSTITKKHKQSPQFHCIYSRFTLHSITNAQQERLLSQISHFLAKNGIVAIEARGLKNSLYQKGEALIDEANAFIYDNHYRRFVDFETLCEILQAKGFYIEFAKEERGFAPFNDEDDYFFRIIAIRGGGKTSFLCVLSATHFHAPRLHKVA